MIEHIPEYLHLPIAGAMIVMCLALRRMAIRAGIWDMGDPDPPR